MFILRLVDRSTGAGVRKGEGGSDRTRSFGVRVVFGGAKFRNELLATSVV